MNHRTDNTVSKGRQLEDEVADIYRQMDGVVEVQQNYVLAGVQIDVYVVMETKDGLLSRYAIDAKNYDANVPSDEVRKCVVDFQMLRSGNKIDRGIIVAKTGFAKEALAAASENGIHTMVIKDLRRRASGFHAYLTNWVDRHESSEFFRLGVYIPLSAKLDDDSPAGKVEDFLIRWLKQPGTLVTLLGNYGTGKSTTLREVMYRQAKAYLANPGAERIPIFVDLKKFRQAPATQSLITDLLVNQSGISMNFLKFSELNSQGRFLIIMDGFDEMAERVLDGVPIEHFNELAQLATGDAKVVISSRTHYFKDHEEVLRAHVNRETELYQEVKRREGFQILFLNPFGRRDIETYLKRRFSDKWSEYKEVIDKTYDLASLAEVPILLSMIVQTLPRIIAQGGRVNRSAIYRSFTEQWLYRDQWRRGLHTEERRFFCRALAVHFYRTQANSVHWRDLPDLIREHLHSRTIDNLDDLDVFSADVRTSNFLVRDDAGYYSFVHKSFMEFFVAESLIENIRAHVGDGLADLRDPSRTPVIWDFLFEMIRDDDLDELRKAVFRATKGKGSTVDLASNKLESTKRLHSNPVSLGNVAAILLHFGVSMDGADLEMARFDNMVISDATFEQAALSGASFKRCTLHHINFKGAVLALSSFDSASLTEVDFTRATLSNTDLRSARIDKETLDSMAHAKHWGSAKMNPLYKGRIRRKYEEPSSRPEKK